MDQQDKQTVRKLSFMAILTLAMLVSVQTVTIIALYRGTLSIQEYMTVWTPMLTLAIGFWFGKQGTGS